MSVANASNYYGSMTIGEYIFLQSLFLPIGCFSIFGNSLVLIAYFKFKQVRDTECAHLVAGLAFGDFICGVGAVIVGLARLEIPLLNDYNFTRAFCIFTSVPNQFGIEMSQCMTMAIALDRILAVSSPFTYRARNHRQYASGSVIMSIFCGCLIVVLSTAGVDFSKPPSRCSWTSSVLPISGNIFTVVNSLFGPFVAVIYGMVIYKQRKLQLIHQQSISSGMDKSSKKFLTAQVSITVMLTKLVIVYCVLVAAPLATLELWTILNLSPSFTSTFLSPLRNVTMSLNSAVNVVVYAHSSSNLHPFLLHLLTCGKKGNIAVKNQAFNAAILSRHSSMPQGGRIGSSVATTRTVITITPPVVAKTTQLPSVNC